ncbi:MAG: family N-acetyltransferase [Bacillales bacterium]|jgi:N-acetylglutamate synthase-like GNAT family acetyltransferase|nr:family N-acetyltransferase [Bacillales bacterium]
MMKIVSIRENPEYKQEAIKYIQSKWASENSLMVYEDCIENSIKTESLLPQWYVLFVDNTIVGCAGLITNDFISRMDLYPWLCALYIEEEYRGKSLGSNLLSRIRGDAASLGFKKLYLCTDHVGYYEKYGYNFIGIGYHPWGESSRIYEIDTNKS